MMSFVSKILTLFLLFWTVESALTHDRILRMGKKKKSSSGSKGKGKSEVVPVPVPSPFCIVIESFACTTGNVCDFDVDCSRCGVGYYPFAWNVRGTTVPITYFAYGTMDPTKVEVTVDATSATGAAAAGVAYISCVAEMPILP